MVACTTHNPTRYVSGVMGNVHTFGVSFPLVCICCLWCRTQRVLERLQPRFELHEPGRTYRSATTQMDLCQLLSVTSEWCFNDHINSVTFLKLVFQINRNKDEWGSSPLHAMFNSNSCFELFPPPSVSVLLAQLTRIHLVLWAVNPSIPVVVFSCTMAQSRWLKSSKEIFPDTQS